MSYAVARIQGYNIGSIGNIGNELERSGNEKIERKNKDIDKSQTHLNEFLKKSKELSMYKEFRRLQQDLKIEGKIRERGKKQSIVMEQALFTSDSKFFNSLGWQKGQDAPQSVQEFFKQAYKFACNYFGERNIVSAVVHYDETTPHLQLMYLPLVDKVIDKKTKKTIYCENPRLNRDQFWKQRGGKKSYTNFQTKWHKFITSKGYELERGVIGSTVTHSSKYEWDKKKKMFLSFLSPPQEQKYFYDSEPQGEYEKLVRNYYKHGNNYVDGVLIPKSDYKTLKEKTILAYEQLKTISSLKKRIEKYINENKEIDNLLEFKNTIETVFSENPEIKRQFNEAIVCLENEEIEY